MSVDHVELLVEELSMEAFLRGFLPKILSRASFEVHPHQSKQEMLKRLPARLFGYSKWLQPNMRVVVLVYRDRDNCKKLKRELETMGSQLLDTA